MKNIIVIIATIFIFPHAFSVKNYGSLMYEITSANLEDTSYIFGTMHLVPKDDFYVWETVLDKVKNSEKIALETNLSMSREEQVAMMEKMALPESTNLSDYIDTTKFNKFKAYVSSHVELPENVSDYLWQLKPFYCISILLSYYLVEPASYDMHFSEIAKKSGIEIIGLETLQFQMDLIDSISIQDQFDLFVNTNIFDEFDKTYKAYSKMDLYMLDKIIREDKNYPLIEDAFIHKRNATWIESIVPIINNNKTFIAVGAGHLIGDKGLLNLLKQRGYTVKPVPLVINDI